MWGWGLRRYLIFRPYLQCGMGNRLKGYRGALGLAMITDRALLVDWYGGLDSSRSGTEHKFEGIVDTSAVEVSLLISFW